MASHVWPKRQKSVWHTCQRLSCKSNFGGREQNIVGRNQVIEGNAGWKNRVAVIEELE